LRAGFQRGAFEEKANRRKTDGARRFRQAECLNCQCMCDARRVGRLGGGDCYGGLAGCGTLAATGPTHRICLSFRLAGCARKDK
jgi:hypothetical protein